MVYEELKFKGIGPKKMKILTDAGYNSRESISSSDFYNIVELPGFGIKTTYSIFEELHLSIPYRDMEEVMETTHTAVEVDGKVIRPWREHRSKKNKSISSGPEDFKLEPTTVWSYPNRGDWASHTPQYRGNWPPQLVRNVLELYSKPGDLILDPMVGGGTTPVECLLTGRSSISVDINPGAIEVTRDRLDLPEEYIESGTTTTHKTFIGDVRNLNVVSSDSIDLIATHPPYVNIISYAPHIDGELSQFSDYNLFFREFSKAIVEMFRVLKPGKKCAILIGDTHNMSHFIPISTRMLLEFLKAGFVLKEDIIKREWNCESNHYTSKYGDCDFLLTMHEHLLIFEKPDGKVKLPHGCTWDFFDDLFSGNEGARS